MGGFKDTFDHIQNKSIQVFFIIKIYFRKPLSLRITLFIVASFIVVQNCLKKVYFLSIRLKNSNLTYITD
jgi:hypothetical protein